MGEGGREGGREKERGGGGGGGMKGGTNYRDMPILCMQREVVAITGGIVRGGGCYHDEINLPQIMDEDTDFGYRSRSFLHHDH